MEGAMGRLCLALVRRRVRAGDVGAWAQDLRAAARRLDELVEELRGKSHGDTLD